MKSSKSRAPTSTIDHLGDGRDAGQVAEAPGPLLTPSMTWAEAGRAVLAFHFARLLANEQGTVDGGNPEALHDMRVAAARLMAALRDFRKAFPKSAAKKLTDEVRWLDDLLGRPRDMDVFMGWLRNYQKDASEEHCAFVDRLIEEREAARARERASLLAGLHSQRYEQLKRDFDRLIQAQSGRDHHPSLVEQATAQIERELKRVRKMKKGANAKHLKRLHRLRIEFKRLRYTSEFFANLYPDHMLRLIKASHKIQDELGGVHDASEYIQFLQEMRKTQASDPGKEAKLQQMIGTLKRQKARQYKAFKKSYRKWRSSRKIAKELDAVG